MVNTPVLRFVYGGHPHLNGRYQGNGEHSGARLYTWGYAGMNGLVSLHKLPFFHARASMPSVIHAMG